MGLKTTVILYLLLRCSLGLSSGRLLGLGDLGLLGHSLLDSLLLGCLRLDRLLDPQGLGGLGGGLLLGGNLGGRHLQAKKKKLG